jgi:8-oxo-dGTP pyrophosphatase MutT (NUDIX family)
MEVMSRVTWEALGRALAGRDPVPIAACSRRAAVAMILRDGPAGIEILFIHRAEHPADPWSGHMAFPGGRAEEGEAPLLTAIRESAEEVGIDLTSAEPLGALDELQAVRRLPIDLAIAPFVFRVGKDARVIPNHEVRGFYWLTVDELMGERFRSTFDYAEGGSVLRFPCFRVDDKVIWGLTYRMFSQLALRLREARSGVAG